MTTDQQAACFAGGAFVLVLTLSALAFYSKAQDDKEYAAILAAHAYTIKITSGRSYEIHYVKKGDYRIENGILYFRAAGKQHVAKENYIISEN
ncbi:MAG: hypothetical protein IKZ07_07235 [Akkermansia sp.]|nr:hypothetical protein [Akkermansia sp.]